MSLKIATLPEGEPNPILASNLSSVEAEAAAAAAEAAEAAELAERMAAKVAIDPLSGRAPVEKPARVSPSTIDFQG